MQMHEPIAASLRQPSRAKALAPRRHYPTLRIKPYRRGPLLRLQWIFGITPVERLGRGEA